MNAKNITVVKCLDQSSYYGSKDKESNLQFVKTSLNYCYEKFKAQGYLFLNEVYDAIGMPRTMQGQVAGWVYDDEYKKDTMWTMWIKHDDCYVYVTFELLDNILAALSNQ